MRSDASHSITMLKQKFDEIKRNINTIEQKQREFFSQGLTESKGITQERNPRPSSVNRFSDTKPRETERTENMHKVIKELEADRLALYRKLEEYKKENENLKDNSTSQEKKIKILQIENQQLRIQLEKYESSTKRPQSCIKDSRSPSKKNRVVFSKELESVYHIDENIPLRKPSPKPSRNTAPYASPIQSRFSYGSYQTLPQPERLYSNDLISSQRRMGLD